MGEPEDACKTWLGWNGRPQLMAVCNKGTLLGWTVSPKRMIEFVNALQLPIAATGLGDTRTLIIPVAPTIFYEAGPETRKTMGISDGMLRLSVGIEDIDDLIADFSQALTLTM
ncbi:PLP-dependent transferase [Cupriavidus sp. H39]|uniref:PLP-dependent transferase n=1 Tax=Cupriavidus sp. H39 TaxID=3401635 RepID=UPI003D01085A